MKIVLNDWDDVRNFVSVLSPQFLLEACPTLAAVKLPVVNNLSVHVAPDTLPADIAKPIDPMAAAQYGHDLPPEGYVPEELPTSASADKAVAETSAALRVVLSSTPVGDREAEPTEIGQIVGFADSAELDSTGRRWDEEIDSAAKTKTKAGAWTRSRRRDLTDERYNERAAELIAKAQADATDEPVATERHALPVDETPKAPDPETKPSVDLAELIEASADASLALTGSMSDLMAASRSFIETHGVAAMNELRAAVAPDPNNPAVGLSVGSLTPAQRALVQACIKNYGKHVPLS